MSMHFLRMTRSTKISGIGFFGNVLGEKREVNIIAVTPSCLLAFFLLTLLPLIIPLVRNEAEKWLLPVNGSSQAF